MGEKRTRSPNGQSKILLDDKGYYTKVSLGRDPATGKPVRRTVRGRTPTIVSAEVNRLKADLAVHGTAVQSNDLTVAQWVTIWLGVVDRTCKPKTHDTYSTICRAYVLPHLGTIRLTKLTPEHVESMYDHVLAEGLKPTSVAAIHRTFRACLNLAVSRRRIATNPVKLARPPRIPRAEIRALNLTEIGQVLTEAARQGDGARWWVALAMGLRQGEALGLRWPDLDLPNGILTIRRAVSRTPYRHGCADPATCAKTHHNARCAGKGDYCIGHARSCPHRLGGGLGIGETKSVAGDRTVSIPPTLIPLLRDHERAQQREWVSQGFVWRRDAYVFGRPGGKPTSPEADHRRWKALLADAGVRSARLHDARHTAATLMLAVKADPREVLSMFGWSQMGLLARYQHPNLAMQERITEAVSDTLATVINLPPQRHASI